MTLLELLMILFVGIALVAWAVGAWAKRRDDPATQARRDHNATKPGN
jgi:hypothetical protein